MEELLQSAAALLQDLPVDWLSVGRDSVHHDRCLRQLLVLGDGGILRSAAGRTVASAVDVPWLGPWTC